MLTLTILLLILNIVQHIQGQCSVLVNQDLDKKTPLFVDIKTATILGPTKRNGEMPFNNGEVVALACPGNTNGVDIRGVNAKIVTAKCVRGNVFQINNNPLGEDIRNVLCRENPVPYLEENGSCASGAGTIIDVGFRVPGQFTNQFMEICFNKNIKRTYYAMSVLEKLEFSCAQDSIAFKNDFFGTVNANAAYTSQYRRLPSSHSMYLLQKGHLVPKCEFADAALKRMTYYYINSAPQWKDFNEGNWKHLENRIRALAGSQSRQSHDFVVYTGSYGDFRDSNNNPLSLVNNGIIPVPSHFWKVVIDTTTGEGVAFVGANDPLRGTILCPDICPSLSWLGNFQNLRTNSAKGYVSCCRVDDLRNVGNIVLPPTFSGYGNRLLA